MPRLNHDLTRGHYPSEALVKDIMSEYDCKFKNVGEPERLAIMGKLRIATKVEDM